MKKADSDLEGFIFLHYLYISDKKKKRDSFYAHRGAGPNMEKGSGLLIKLIFNFYVLNWHGTDDHMEVLLVELNFAHIIAIRYGLVPLITCCTEMVFGFDVASSRLLRLGHIVDD